jgi:hypothetical protein
LGGRLQAARKEGQQSACGRMPSACGRPQQRKVRNYRVSARQTRAGMSAPDPKSLFVRALNYLAQWASGHNCCCARAAPKSVPITQQNLTGHVLGVPHEPVVHRRCMQPPCTLRAMHVSACAPCTPARTCIKRACMLLYLQLTQCCMMCCMC